MNASISLLATLVLLPGVSHAQALGDRPAAGEYRPPMKESDLTSGRQFPMTLVADVIPVQAGEPSIEIAGVTITRGMPEVEVRAAFRRVSCDEKVPNSCSVGDGIPPEYDGDITFEHGEVRSAARNLTVPEGSDEVLMLLHGTMERLAGVAQSCARIQLHSLDNGLKYVTIMWPDKAIWIQVHESWPHTMIKETLRPATESADTGEHQSEKPNC